MTLASSDSSRPVIIAVLAVIAVLFGGLTLFSGGATLFVDGPARAAAGNYVGFVLWFNFLAGFAYIVAGVGLFLWRRWAAYLPKIIAGATLLVFAALGIYIATGGAYEARTVSAMVLRSGVWIAIAAIVHFAWAGKTAR